MTKRERTLRKQFTLAMARHRRKPTAASWFALGTILAESYAVSEELGAELSEGLGDPIACWKRCVKLAPRHSEAWHRLGDAYYQAADSANAERALKRAL